MCLPPTPTTEKPPSPPLPFLTNNFDSLVGQYPVPYEVLPPVSRAAAVDQLEGVPPQHSQGQQLVGPAHGDRGGTLGEGGERPRSGGWRHGSLQGGKWVELRCSGFVRFRFRPALCAQFSRGNHVLSRMVRFDWIACLDQLARPLTCASLSPLP